MISLLASHKEVIAALCRKYSVQRLFAFGSAIRDDFRPGESDVDLLVEFTPIGGHAKFHAYFEMLDELQSILGTKVALVMSGAVRNALIAREIEKTKRLIYGACYICLPLRHNGRIRFNRFNPCGDLFRDFCCDTRKALCCRTRVHFNWRSNLNPSQILARQFQALIRWPESNWVSQHTHSQPCFSRSGDCL